MVWMKEMRGFPTLFITEFGDIWDMGGDLPRKLNVYNMKGYKAVSIKSKSRMIHRLVAQNFLGYSKSPVNHKDGVKTNNHYSNLEYCTLEYNIKHAWDNKLTGRLDFTDKKVELIIKHLQNTDLSYSEIGEIFEVVAGFVKRIHEKLDKLKK